MDKDFSIEELLSEYNERLDRLGGKKKEPEKKDVVELGKGGPVKKKKCC